MLHAFSNIHNEQDGGLLASIDDGRNWFKTPVETNIPGIVDSRLIVKYLTDYYYITITRSYSSGSATIDYNIVTFKSENGFTWEEFNSSALTLPFGIKLELTKSAVIKDRLFLISERCFFKDRGAVPYVALSCAITNIGSNFEVVATYAAAEYGNGVGVTYEDYCPGYIFKDADSINLNRKISSLQFFHNLTTILDIYEDSSHNVFILRITSTPEKRGYPLLLQKVDTSTENWYIDMLSVDETSSDIVKLELDIPDPNSDKIVSSSKGLFCTVNNKMTVCMFTCKYGYNIYALTKERFPNLITEAEVATLTDNFTIKTGYFVLDTTQPLANMPLNSINLNTKTHHFSTHNYIDQYGESGLNDRLFYAKDETSEPAGIATLSSSRFDNIILVPQHSYLTSSSSTQRNYLPGVFYELGEDNLISAKQGVPIDLSGDTSGEMYIVDTDATTITIMNGYSSVSGSVIKFPIWPNQPRMTGELAILKEKN